MSTQIIDHGQIKLLNLPEGFEEISIGEPQSETLREFQIPDQEKVRLCLFYRGYPVSKKAGDFFRNLLAGKPHVLKSEEIRNLAEILDDAAYPDLFIPFIIKTELINDKAILSVEGRWKQQEWDTTSLFIDADGSGCIIQQVIGQIKKCLRSIEWN